MVRPETKTAEQKERDRDKRYRKAYRIGLDTYNKIGESQHWRCGACGRHQSEFTVSLNVDHEHFKIMLEKKTDLDGSKYWVASTYIRWRDAHLSQTGKTQKTAKENLKRYALPLSIRGLLCPGRYTGCNRLMGRIDHPEWLEKVLAYLKNPPARQILS